MVSISAKSATACPCCSSSNLLFWGTNSYGQNGNGAADGLVYGPTAIGSGTWVSVCFLIYGCVAVKSNGTLWFWGYNTSGELGNGVADSLVYAPTQIGIDSNWISVSKIEDGSLSTVSGVIGLKTDGTLWFWGTNGNGCQRGNGVNDFLVYTPVQISSVTNWAAVYNTTRAVYGLKTDGTLWFWGLNSNGQNGSGVADSLVYAPTRIGSASDWVNIYPTDIGGGIDTAIIGLKTDGTLWFWGLNSNGQNGSGVADSLVYAPTQIGSASDWVNIYHSNGSVIAHKADGTLWFWGRNSGGEDGSGVADNLVHAPTRIGVAANWISVGKSNGSIFAIKSNGSIWFWGTNYYGQNGSGVADSLVYGPTQIGTESNWVSIFMVYSGSNIASAGIGIKASGSLWFWGLNNYGQNGSGAANGISYVPTRIGLAENWVNIFSKHAGNVYDLNCVIGLRE